LSSAASRGRFALNPGLDDVRSATDTWCYADGTGRTIQGTSAAFHASINITDFSFFSIHSKNPMGANNCANAAADTCLRIKLKGRHTF
jgi:hypothetical protein